MGFNLPALEALVFRLKDKVFVRIIRTAHKQALLEWRDRRTGPGLAARFTMAGEKYYGFGDRWGSYWQKKGYLPDYVKTGRLRDSNLARKPRSINGQGATVVTRFKFGGGALFNLTNVGGLIEVKKTTSRVPVTISAYTYARAKTGTMVSVAQHQVTRKRTVFTALRSSRSMAEDFTDTSRDRPWIADRVDRIIGQQLRELIATISTRRSKLGKAARAAIGDD